MEGGYINEGGQLKTKNGQKYIINERRDGIFVPKSCAILSAIIALLTLIIAILITYFVTSGASDTRGCTNGNNLNASTAAASIFGLPISSKESKELSSKLDTKAEKIRNLEFHEGWNPEHYTILIEPNLQTSTNNGTVTIQLTRDHTVKGIRPIVLDVNNVTISDVTVFETTNDNDKLIEIDSKYGENKETFIINIVSGIDVASEQKVQLRVELQFASQLTDTLQGIYKTSYANANDLKEEWMVSTQFSPIDARRAFPCIDRPDKKANFSISIVHEIDKIALSNMPSLRSSYYRPGYVREDFETTPTMPTYLVAFVVSNLVKSTYPDDNSNSSLRVNVWTRSEAADMTKYADSLTRKAVPFFEEYFGIPYQLPKIDLVSIPDFGFSAMENWGLITFRDSSLLVPEDMEKTAAAAHTEYVASIISHELAHQWFGNLVTPKRWDDLWLKEGFSTYMGYLATNHIHPEWNVLERFTIYEFPASMEKDSDISSHPISFPVNSTSDIRRIFDPISYSKGTILLRMLNSIIGEEAFRSSIRDFLNKFSYSNADHDDLWDIMTMYGHEVKTLPEDLHVKDIMKVWTSQAGYPVISVQRNEADLIVTQQRYMLPERNVTDDSKWFVPITFETDESRRGDDIPTHWLTKDQRETVIRNVFSSSNNSDNVVYLNLNRQGYYRVNYDYPSWIILKKKFRELPKITRAQLLDDALHLARSEYITYDVPLTFLLEMFEAHNDELLWASAQQGLNYLVYMLHREPAYESFRAFMRFIVRPAYDHYGLAEPENETHLELSHRAQVVQMACKFNYDRCTNAAQLKYREWMRDPPNNIIKPNLKHTIYCTALSEGSFQEWYFAYKRYGKTTSASEKEQILSALGCTTKPWLLSKYLNMTINPEFGIRKQDGARAFSAVARNPIGYEIAFDFLSTNIEEIAEYFGDGFSTLSKMIDSITTYMNREQHKEQLMRFAAKARKLGLKSIENSIALAMEQVNNNIFWRKRSYYSLQKYLEEMVREFNINVF